MRKKLSSNAPSAAARRRLAKLARQPDTTIDFSDIPPLTDKFWRNAARNSAPSGGFCSMNLFYRPIKQQLTLRRRRLA